MSERSALYLRECIFPINLNINVIKIFNLFIRLTLKKVQSKNYALVASVFKYEYFGFF